MTSIPLRSHFTWSLPLVVLALATVPATAADAPPPVARKPLPFVEEFNDNAAGWSLKFDSIDAVIRDGRLEFENLSAEPNSVFWLTQELAQAPAGDFEIAVTMAPPEGVATGEAGLVFDLNAQGGRRVVQLSRDSFRYDHFHDGRWDLEFNRFTKWPGIRAEPGAKNDLAFRVLGQRGFILINGTAVHALDYKQSRANYAGVIVSSGTMAAFDRLAIQPLKLTDAARTAEAARLEREARASTIAAGPKLEPFVETFEDNRHQWPFLGESETSSGAIKEGALFSHNKRDKNTSLDLITVPINDAADYEITMRARNAGAKDDHQVSLVWGRSSDGAYIEGFAFSGNRQWVSYAVADGKSVRRHPWRPSSAVKASGEMNELVVRKLGDTVFLLINGQVVGEFPARRLHGSGFGVEIGPGIQAAVDELRVTYPALSPEAVEKQKRELLAALEVAHAKKELGATSSVAARKEAEAKQLAAQPTKKDWDEQDKLDRKYRNKKMLSVLADRPNTARRTGSESAPLLYYHYRNIGGVDYYWEFQCMHVGSPGKLNLHEIVVTGVVLTSHIRQY
ncbi:MAG TPA: hypothetical protein VHN79_03475 [Lacunisphaera sp.]|nr:hypothetical protein [Lacunisphaera sp.]